MTAAEHLSGPQFYHGTTAQLRVGDMITSAAQRGVPSRLSEGQEEHNYFTRDPNRAGHYSQMHGSYFDGRYVYQVKPTGPIEFDRNHSIGQGGYRSRSPLRVTGVHSGQDPKPKPRDWDAPVDWLGD